VDEGTMYSDDDDDGSSWIEEHLFGGRGSEEESGDS
jgi:hypothetical protein